MEQLEQYQVILGSSSPRRYDIITGQMGLHNVTVMKPLEELDKNTYGSDSIGYLRANCQYKATSIITQLNSNTSKSIVICADTIVVDNEGHILEKPTSTEEQLDNLQKFQKSSDPILVHTCVELILWDPVVAGGVSRRLQFVETTSITFNKNLPQCVLEHYVKSGEGLQAAGGFNIQGGGGVLIDSITGDYYNVVGLPLSSTLHGIFHLVDFCCCEFFSFEAEK